jgi:hypothetical protein
MHPAAFSPAAESLRRVSAISPRGRASQGGEGHDHRHAHHRQLPVRHDQPGAAAGSGFRVEPPAAAAAAAPPSSRVQLALTAARAALSPEQLVVLDAVRSGRSIFLTGSAGTGKSFVLKALVDVLRATDGSDVCITAASGAAADNVGGVTLHSFAGIGMGTDEKELLLKRVCKVRRCAGARGVSLLTSHMRAYLCTNRALLTSAGGIGERAVDPLHCFNN